MNIVRRSY